MITQGGIIDAHAHVFRPEAISPRDVDQLAPAGRDAPVEDLLTLMAASGVDSAVLVPLDAHDDYVAGALDDHPKTFAAIAVAKPAELRAGGARGVEIFAPDAIASTSTVCAPSGWVSPVGR